MSNINKTAVLIPFSDLTAKEHSDRLTAIDANVASTLATQKSEVAAAIAQVNLTQSQTITALTLEVSNLKTNLTASITATQTDLINRADQLAQEVTDITQQLTQDKATFTQEIQDALDSLKDGASVASALRTPRKIQGVDFDGTQNISLPEAVAYSLPTASDSVLGGIKVGSGLDISNSVLSVGTLNQSTTGNAATASKLQTARTINGVAFDGTANITTPTATETVAGIAKIATTAIAQAGTNDTDIITALKLKQSFTSQHGYTGWEKLPDGLIIQWGLAAVGTTAPFPIAFPTACYQVAVSYSSASAGVMLFQHQSIVASRTGVYMFSGGVQNSYIAIGK